MAKRASTSKSGESGGEKPATSRTTKSKPAAPIPESAFPMVALFHGEEAFLRRQKTDELRASIEASGVPVELVRFDGAAVQPADVFDECRTFGLMQQHKVVVVDEADAFVKGDNRRAVVERYAESPSPNATLILRAERWYPGKLDKLIDKVGVVAKCDAPKPAEAVKWVEQRAKSEHKRAIESDAARLLVERIGVELGRLDTELEKLALNAPADAKSSPPISAQEVREMVGMAREDKAWEIQPFLMRPDAQAALAKLKELVEVSRVDAVPLRWSYVDLARKLHAASRMLRAGANPGQVFSELRLWGESGNAAVALAKRVEPSRFADLVRAAIEADVRGKTSAGDEVRALEVLTLRFASLAQ